MIDLESEFGRQALGKLGSEMVVWLTTVSSNGTPQPRPVWFIWQDGRIIIYSMPTAKKVKHIRNNPNISLHFNMSSPDEAVFVIIGKAILPESPILVAEVRQYLQKYSDGIRGIGLTPESMSTAYSTRIEIIPTQMRGI